MRKRLMGAAAVLIAAAGTVGACTAESMVDQARNTRQDDVYKAARDVAQNFIDTEKFVNDVYTLDAGTGSLLWEKDVIGAMERRKGNPLALPLPTTGATRDELTAYWQSALDRVSGAGVGHGLNTAGARVTGTDCTIRDHMRQHVKEWHDALNGDGTLDLKVNRLSAATSPAAAPSAPAVAPRPAPVASRPAPVPVPQPTTIRIIRRAPPADPASSAPISAPAIPAAPAVDHAG